jgi:hypothetical protein
VLKVNISVEEKIKLVEQLLKELEEIQQEILEQEALVEIEPETLEDIVAKEVFDETAEQEQLAEELMEQLTYEEKRELENAHEEALAELAKEDEKERMKDLTALMKQTPVEMAKAQEQNEQEETKEEQQEGETEQPPEKLEVGATPPVTLSPDTPGILARKIADDGVPTEWMYVDSWYTIGPFSNESRRNLNTKFPPETVVDLDAQYTGKGNRPIKWTFVQGRDMCVIPADDVEYAIYYAYTEIHSDRPRDVWIAVGSDDKANVWINDMPVWISGDKLKGWRPNEGYRKVHLREGVNKVLYRVENGWRGTAFSMAIHVKREGL